MNTPIDNTQYGRREVTGSKYLNKLPHLHDRCEPVAVVHLFSLVVQHCDNRALEEVPPVVEQQLV